MRLKGRNRGPGPRWVFSYTNRAGVDKNRSKDREIRLKQCKSAKKQVKCVFSRVYIGETAIL